LADHADRRISGNQGLDDVSNLQDQRLVLAPPAGDASGRLSFAWLQPEDDARLLVPHDERISMLEMMPELLIVPQPPECRRGHDKIFGPFRAQRLQVGDRGSTVGGMVPCVHARFILREMAGSPSL